MTENAQYTTVLIDDYDYKLPFERIAKYPIPQRDHAKLLIYKQGKIKEDVFVHAADYLPEGSLLVFNNTKVIHARLLFRKTTGASIEIFCLEPIDPSDYALSLSTTNSCVWKCLIGNRKKWKSGALSKTIQIGNESCELKSTILSSSGNSHEVQFSWDNPDISFAEILDHAGELPIPPYLNRETEAMDEISYQTVYAKQEGSVAAPTAGLHFTEHIMASLKQKKIEQGELTLHIGAGTFQPVKSADIKDHQMHTEFFSVGKNTIAALSNKLGHIIAVGTTTVRTLESLYQIGIQIIRNKFEKQDLFFVGQWEAYEQRTDISTETSLQAISDYLKIHQLEEIHAQTQIIIQVGYQFKLIEGMFTNFHQPRSTLLLLVSAFVGDDWRRIYDYAMQHDFRFLSYGDSSLLLR